MACCAPSCAIPSCASAPVVGLGSTGCGPWGYSYRGLSPCYGYGSARFAESARNLGTLARVAPSCISQIPASEVTIQPPPVVVTLPGPILSASCEPVTVGGHSPCAPVGIGHYGGHLGRLGHHGSICSFGRKGSICTLPC